MNIEVAKVGMVASTECISCQACVLSCPKAGALEYKTGNKTLKTLTVIILVVGLFGAGVIISKTVGIFQVTQKQVTAGSELNVDDIKGYMTIKDVSVGTKIELKEVYKKLGIPVTVPEDTKLKEVSNFVEGFEVDASKEKLK